MESTRQVSEKTCPICGSIEITVFVEITNMPVHCNLLWPTRDAAIKAPRGDIQLGFCSNCGHVFNLAFKPERMQYAQNYENSLHFSPKFQTYAIELAARLIDRYQLHGKDIIEIGCGDGDFLKLLCQTGQNRGFGFDPSYVPGPSGDDAPTSVTFIRDFYSERYAALKADLICCRHTLEHLFAPTTFLSVLRRAIGDRLTTSLFFEVPNVLSTLRDLAIWDIIYEHYSYFSPYSLRHLFVRCGFEVCTVAETFQNQFLCLEAMPVDAVANVAVPATEVNKMSHYVTAFASQYSSTIQAWRAHLETINQAGQRAVIWGGGSKGVTFLNTLQTGDQIQYVVDINPRKHGMYIVGTGQQVIRPSFLCRYRPDVVLVMNGIYEAEIRQTASDLGLTGLRFLCISDRPVTVAQVGATAG